MRLVTDFTVINRGRTLDVDLPFELRLDDGLMATLELDDEGRLRLLIVRPVNRMLLERVLQPGVQRRREDGTYEDAYAIRIRDDNAPEHAVASNVLSALTFLTDVPLSLSHRLDGDRFEPDDRADEALLEAFGSAEPYVEISASLMTRTFGGKPTPERVHGLLPRHVGLRIYAGAIATGFPVAQYRELWRVLESAFARKDRALLALLSEFPPVRSLEFDEQELRDLHTLRGRASHAESKKGLEELVAVQHDVQEALPRLKNLVERVIATKRTWGQPSTGVEEVLPLSGWIGRDR